MSQNESVILILMHANRIFPHFCFFTAALFLLLAGPGSRAQQASPAPGNNPAATSADPEFLATADEVMNEMAEITGWKVKTPLKKSIRTRAEIHAYILSEMDDEKDAQERYASARSAEAFGLLPKNFDLDHFLVDLLTEQIAGLYDPKKHEFYIADWIQPDEQRMVMSHELTHALQDQYFHIDAWARAAKPNDDAELARESVLEGSAMAGMLEYEMRDKGLKLTDLPDIDPSIFVGDLNDTPMLKKAPQFIKDSLMFPYFDGLRFSMSILRGGGWSGFAPVFDRPPSGTQQIMHPLLYRENKQPMAVKVDLPEGVPGDGWTKLEENVMGEFGWKEVLKQFLDEERAKKVMTGWDGDDYATYEQKDNKQNLMLFTRLHFDSAELASGFFAAYRDALKRKYPERTIRVDAANGLEFKSSSSVNVFFRCQADQCITLEGGDAVIWEKWTKKLGWPANATPTPANTANSGPIRKQSVLASAA
ncbi:MAG TPA: hypothetical protein VMU53_11625 [Candidatus Sulfotelmatobacter sp.]|nr:hypothetical protein [Candidatus Sulfotelmatobacter sp.]